MPTTPLEPGSTNTAAVKQLQDWLVSQGYMTQAQVNTGYGTYGPQTTAAVLAYQKAKGVDYSSGPGYWGPRTIAAASGQAAAPASSTSSSTAAPTSQPTSSSGASGPIVDKSADGGRGFTYTPNGDGTYRITDYLGRPLDSHASLPASLQAQITPVATPTPTPTPTSTSTTTTGTGVTYDPSWSTYGIDQATWSQMNPTQQGVVAAALTAAKGLYSANASNVTLSDALAAAAKDPTIISKYADALKLDTAALSQSMQQLQQATSTTAQLQQTQFEEDRRALAEKEAAAGAASSGFRGRAQNELQQSENAIVTSSRSAVQKSLDDATAAFVAKYGTTAPGAATAATFVDPTAASGISISGLATTPDTTSQILMGTLPQGITGTATTSKQEDINARAGQYVAAGQIPAVTPA